MSQGSSGAARCRACAAALAPGSARCPRCGADPRAETCPHCRAIAGVSPHDELRFRCDVCGGPRVPLTDARIQRSGREIASLQKARAAASSRSGFRAAGIAAGVLLGFELFLFTLLLLVLGASVGLFITALLTMAPVVGFVFWALQRAKARGREITPALDAAWLAVAADVARQAEPPFTARRLAAILSIGEAQAEELLALLEVNDVVRGAVTPAGEFGYAPKMRIGAPPAAATEGSAEASAIAAEEEALAAGQSLDPLPQRTVHVDPTKR